MRSLKSPSSPRRSPRVGIISEKDSFFSIFSVNTIEHIDQEWGADFEALGSSGEKNYLDIRREPPEFIRLLDRAYDHQKPEQVNLDREKMHFLEFLQSEKCQFERKGEYFALLNGLVQQQKDQPESTEKCFFEYFCKKSTIIKSHSQFAKQFISRRLVALLEQFQANEARKEAVIKQHGFLDFSDEAILELSYNEYSMRRSAEGPLRLEKVKPAQEFLAQKRYDLYLLDLSVINRWGEGANGQLLGESPAVCELGPGQADAAAVLAGFLRL